MRSDAIATENSGRVVLIGRNCAPTKLDDQPHSFGDSVRRVREPDARNGDDCYSAKVAVDVQHQGLRRSRQAARFPASPTTAVKGWLERVKLPYGPEYEYDVCDDHGDRQESENDIGYAEGFASEDEQAAAHEQEDDAGSARLPRFNGRVAQHCPPLDAEDRYYEKVQAVGAERSSGCQVWRVETSYRCAARNQLWQRRSGGKQDDASPASRVLSPRLSHRRTERGSIRLRIRLSMPQNTEATRPAS